MMKYSSLLLVSTLTLPLVACASDPEVTHQTPVTAEADDDIQGVISLDDLKKLDDDTGGSDSDGSADDQDVTDADDGADDPGQDQQADTTPAPSNSHGTDDPDSTDSSASDTDASTDDLKWSYYFGQFCSFAKVYRV